MDEFDSFRIANVIFNYTVFGHNDIHNLDEEEGSMPKLVSQVCCLKYLALKVYREEISENANTK